MKRYARDLFKRKSERPHGFKNITKNVRKYKDKLQNTLDVGALTGSKIYVGSLVQYVGSRKWK
jgi:hypothetical protein